MQDLDVETWPRFERPEGYGVEELGGKAPGHAVPRRQSVSLGYIIHEIATLYIIGHDIVVMIM